MTVSGESILKNIARHKRTASFLTFIFLVIIGCVDPYTPATTSANVSYLVIDGVLDTKGDTSRFVLSRTRPANTDSIYNTPEIASNVSIEEEGGQSHSLIGDGNGNYYLPPGLLTLAANVRMHVFGSDGREYVSSYVPPLVTPPIDTVTADTSNLTTINGVKGLDISVSTHDPTYALKYFLWRFEETWKYNSGLQSDYILDDNTIRNRTFDEGIYFCYHEVPSANVLVASTTNLSADIIRNFPLTHIPLSSPKLRLRYTINVHQYALTKEGYEFWLALQKNTESLGSIFGSLPVTVTGNFTCVTDPSIPVVGFFNATSVSSKRIFVDSNQLPELYAPDPFYASCETTFVAIGDALNPTTLLYLDPVYKGITLIGYQLGNSMCADCRSHGGTTVVPSYWVN